MNKVTFPNNYPDELKGISWVTGEIAGPQKYWNKFISTRFKSSKYYVKNVVRRVFEENKVFLSPELNELINYFLKCFTIYFIDDEFKISMKKNKNKEAIFSDMQWKSLCNACGINGREPVDLLKHLLRQIYKFYNNLLKSI